MEVINFREFMDRDYVLEVPVVSTTEKLVELVFIVGITMVAVKVIPLVMIPIATGVMGR